MISPPQMIRGRIFRGPGVKRIYDLVVESREEGQRSIIGRLAASPASIGPASIGPASIGTWRDELL